MDTYKLIQVLQIAKKLKRFQTFLKTCHGDDYQNRIKKYIDHINEVMVKENINVAEALIKISESKEFEENETLQLHYFAAVVEISESKENN